MRLQCPNCETEMLVEDDDRGRVVSCTSCRAKLRAPLAPETDDSEDDEPGEEAPLTGGGADDSEYADLVDMTAMVDIVFFLLIFFMITTVSGVLSCIDMPPTKQEGSAAASRRAADSDPDADTVVVRIDSQNRIFIDDLEFPTEADVRGRLRSARALQAKKLHVKAHGDAFNGTFVMVQDIGHDLDFEAFMLTVAKEEEPQ